MTKKQNFKVAALYRFMDLENLPDLRKLLRDDADRLGICGTLLLAPEGINGTIAGTPEKLDEYIDILDDALDIRKGELKYSSASKQPFLRMKVRLKKEIITMRTDEAKPTKTVGQYISAEDWNDLVSRDDVTLLDTRNDYETKVGIFKNAIDPDIQTFTEFKDYVEKHLNPEEHKKVAMYCTGGIRCEKASSYMLNKGFEEVYHLKGGILKYLEDVPQDESLWEGDCFVFDHRVSVGHGLEEGDYAVCFACREPLSLEEQQSDTYEKGVSCPHCIENLTPEREKALRMRHKDITSRFTA